MSRVGPLSGSNKEMSRSFLLAAEGPTCEALDIDLLERTIPPRGLMRGWESRGRNSGMVTTGECPK